MKKFYIQGDEVATTDLIAENSFGKNMLSRTTNFNGWVFQNAEQGNIVSPFGNKSVHYTKAWSSTKNYANQYNFNGNEVLAFSCNIFLKSDKDPSLLLWDDGNKSGSITKIKTINSLDLSKKNQWQYISYIFTPYANNNSVISVQNRDDSDFYLADFMLVKGTLPYKWSLSEKDIAKQTDVDTLKAEIQALKNKIGGVTRHLYAGLISALATSTELEVA